MLPEFSLFASGFKGMDHGSVMSDDCRCQLNSSVKCLPYNVLLQSFHNERNVIKKCGSIGGI
jgi:hypothetical protein